MDAKIIGARIAGSRKSNGLSQAQLAQQLYISPQAVGKWERGESVPDIITMNRICEILTVEMNFFSENATLERKPESIHQSYLPEESTAVEQEDARQTQNNVFTQLPNYVGANLQGNDFAGIRAKHGGFNACSLIKANFSDAVLSESAFDSSNLYECNFNRSVLNKCSFFASNLANTLFTDTTIEETTFRACETTGSMFNNVTFRTVKFTKIELTKSIFKNCTFENCSFDNADLTGACMEGQTFIECQFNNTVLAGVSFKDAKLKKVSFSAKYAITNKFYKAISTINFDGSKIDKITYATLQGFGAQLANAHYLSPA